MIPLPCHPVSAGARPGPGRPSSGPTALRGLHLDRTCAPAITWQLTGSGDRQDQPNQSVHTFRGTPPKASGHRLLAGHGPGVAGSVMVTRASLTGTLKHKIDAMHQGGRSATMFGMARARYGTSVMTSPRGL
jgi:hypothetical protein